MAQPSGIVARKRSITAVLASAAMCTGLLVAVQSPAAADHEIVTATEGSAYGCSASVSLFGGPPGPRDPTPAVALPPGGSAVPIAAAAPTCDIIYGPATIFSSGPVTVSTQGTTGPNGTVTSTSTLGPINTSQSEIFTAANLSSTCTADETGATGSTTITGGTLIVTDPNPDVAGEEGEEIVTLPVNPEPNLTYEGTISPPVSDNFRAVFNEQIVDPVDGSLTVNAYHLYLLGPTAVGDVIAGQTVCGVTTEAAPPGDADNDGVPDETDNCPDVANPGQEDADNDEIGDVCEAPVDTDGDGAPDALDNCPTVPNADQTDSDGDQIGDACDTVEPVNTPPVAGRDSYETTRDTPLTVPAPGVLGNDTDIDGDTLTVISNTQPRTGRGTVVMNPDGSFTYTPAPGTVGGQTFRYTVSDGNGGTATGTVTVTIVRDPTECNDQLPTIVGTEGDDVLVGTEGPDIINGLGGNDTITGLGGDDTICGSAGNDDIDGGDGNDRIEGGEGDDHLQGKDGNDAILGGDGDDKIDGGHGHDSIFAGPGNNTVRGGKGNDGIFGGSDSDRIDGGQGNDTIFGGGGDDLLLGSIGDDVIFGEGGTDTCDRAPEPAATGTNTYFDCEEGAGAPVP